MPRGRWIVCPSLQSGNATVLSSQHSSYIFNKHFSSYTSGKYLHFYFLFIIIINSMYVCCLQSKLLQKELQRPFGNNLNRIASEQTVCGWGRWIKQCQRHTNPQQTQFLNSMYSLTSFALTSDCLLSCLLLFYSLWKINCNRDFIDESGKTYTDSFALTYRKMSWSLLLGSLMVRLSCFTLFACVLTWSPQWCSNILHLAFHLQTSIIHYSIRSLHTSTYSIGTASFFEHRMSYFFTQKYLLF